jgi:hypothetical protein
VDALGICNLALGWLGQAAITQLNLETPASTTEELCARLYPEALRAVLEARAWTFATQRLQFEPAAATGLADFPSKYPIPATVVRVLSCDDGGGSNDIEWRREGGYILTETSPTKVYAKAIMLEEDASKFSPSFGRALAARLAADLAMPLTENRARAEFLEAQYLRELMNAARLDGQQGTAEKTRPSGLAARRW